MPRNKQAFNGDSASTSIPAKKIKTESETFKECESVGKKKKTIRVVNVDVNNDDHTYGTNDTETQIGISTPHSMSTQSLSTTSLPARLLNDQINSSRSRFISTLCSEPPAPSSLYPPLRPSTSSHCLAQNQQRSVPIARHPHPRFSILRPVCPSVPVFSTVTAIPIPSTIVRLPVPVQPPPPPPKKKPKQRRFLPIQTQLRISELKQPSSKSPVANVTQFQASTSASNSTDEPNDTGPVPVETTLDPSQPPLTLNHFIRGFLNKHKITWGDSHKSSTLTQQQRIDSILNQYFEDLRRKGPTTSTSNGFASVEDSTSASTSTQPDDTGPVPVERLTHFIHDFLNRHKLIWVDKTPEEMGRQSELGSGCQREQVNSSTEQLDMEQAVDSILRQCFGDMKKEISASTSFRHTQSQSAVTSNGEANGNSMAVHVQMQLDIVKTEPEDEADGNGAAEERTSSSTTTANKAAEGPADNSEPATMQQIMPKEEPNIGQEVGGEGHEPEAMVEEQEQSLAPNLDARKAEIRQKLCEMLHRNGLINVGIVAGDGFRHFARELLELGICEANNPTGSTAFSGAEIAALLPTMDELRPLDGSEVIENGTNSSKAESDE